MKEIVALFNITLKYRFHAHSRFLLYAKICFPRTPLSHTLPFTLLGTDNVGFDIFVLKLLFVATKFSKNIWEFSFKANDACF